MRDQAVSVTDSPILRVGLFQQQIPDYRVGVFERLAGLTGIRLTIYSSAFSSTPSQALCRPVRPLRWGRARLHPAVLWSLLTREQDVIICEGSVAIMTSLCVVIFRRLFGARTVWWTSLWNPDGSVGIAPGFRGLMTRHALRRATAVLTYSHTAATAALSAGVESQRVFVATNSLDTDALREVERQWRGDAARLLQFRRDHSLEGCRVVLFVGRLIEKKKIHILIAAFARLVADNEHAALRLVIVGDGPDRTRLERLCDSLGIRAYTRFAGHIRALNEVCPYFLSARVMVLPGPGGLAINQALTHGIPTIVAGGDGTERDVIEDGRNGYLIQADDVGLLCDRMRNILFADETQWNRMSNSARSAITERANVRLMIQGFSDAVRFAWFEARDQVEPSPPARTTQV